MKFWTNHKGTLLVAFRGNNRLRTLLTATNYGAAGMAGKKISMIESAFRTTGANAKAGAKALGSKAGVIGMVFVTVVDIGTYIADPNTEKELSDLFVDLGFDLSTGAVSAITGTIVAGIVIAGASIITGGMAIPVVIVVSAGIGISVVVGYGIGYLVSLTGVRKSLKEAIKNTESKAPVVDDLYRGMMLAP